MSGDDDDNVQTYVASLGTSSKKNFTNIVRAICWLYKKLGLVGNIAHPWIGQCAFTWPCLFVACAQECINLPKLLTETQRKTTMSL